MAVQHGRDPQLSGRDGTLYAAVCLCGDTVRAQTQATADTHLTEHIEDQPHKKAA